MVARIPKKPEHCCDSGQKRGCRVNRFTLQPHFARNCSAFRLISGGRPCCHGLPLPRRCRLPSTQSLLGLPTISKGFARGSAIVQLFTCNAPLHNPHSQDRMAVSYWNQGNYGKHHFLPLPRKCRESVSGCSYEQFQVNQSRILVYGV